MVILILLRARNELSYDRFHANAGNIYRVITEDHRADGVSVHAWLPFPLGPAPKNESPEISAVSRWAPEDMVVRYKDEARAEARFLTVDPANSGEFNRLGWDRQTVRLWPKDVPDGQCDRIAQAKPTFAAGPKTSATH